MASSRTITTLTIIGVVFVSTMMIAMSAIIIDNRVQITVLAAQVTRLENKVLQWQLALRDVQDSVQDLAQDCCRKTETKPPERPAGKPTTLPSKDCTCKKCTCKQCNCTKEKCKCLAPSS